MAFDQKAYNRRYYVAHRDEWAARNAAYRATHPDEVRAYNAAYLAAHRGENAAHGAAYHAAHRAEAAVRSAAYYEAHREEIKSRSAAWYREHPEEARVRRTLWYKTHPDKVWRNHHQSKARRRGAKLCSHASCRALGAAALAWQTSPHVCYLCGTPVWRGVNLHMDHVIPISKGGLHCAENLRPACGPCNMHKHAKIAHTGTVAIAAG